jgi:hypothetical protein
VNPFDEPNVAESKRNTTDLLTQWTQDRSFAEGTPLAADDWMIVYGQPDQSSSRARTALSPESVLRPFLDAVRSRDYLALLAYVHRTPPIHESLMSLCTWLRHRLQQAATLGYGPAYLHSTGQLHKGGPGTGVFLLLTADPSEDLPIPGEAYGFGTLQRAQALGDYRALVSKARRVLRVHLRGEVEAAALHLGDTLRSAFARETANVR